MSDKVAKCQKIPNSEIKKKSREQRSVRDISVKTFPSRLENSRDDWGLPKYSRENTPASDKSKDSPEEKSEIGFFSGNPFVEITKGVFHLYKQDVLTSKDEAVTLCLLGGLAIQSYLVCLERMDESVAGVLTILCNHAFHTSCLEQWSDSTCPVCRCVQIPEEQELSECEECGKSAPSMDLLWICLICGHVGCGRYQGGHAASHYRETGH